MKLERTLGFWAVFCIAAGAMISSGLFVLPGVAFAQAGPAVILSYALAGLMVIPAMLAQAELATAMPRSGGSYFYIERSMGALPGTMAGLANWLSIALKAAFALIGIGAFARLVWGSQPEWVIKAIAIGICLLFAAVNMISVKHTGRIQVGMVAFLLAILVGFVVFGLPAVRHSHLAGFMDKGLGRAFGTAGLVFISYGGLTKVASVAGEVRHPGRNIPGGMIAAWAVVSLLYVAAVFVVVGVVPAESTLEGQLVKAAGLRNNLTPLSVAAKRFMGTFGEILLAVGAMLAFITTGNSGILSASRSPMAMSRDGLLPQWFQKTSRRFGTPHASIAVTAAFMIAIISLLTVKGLVEAASTMMLILFMLVNAAVLIMRGSRIQNYRPLFRMPFFPWLPLAGICVYGFLIMEMTLEMDLLPLLTTAGFAVAAAVWYVFYVSPRAGRESALVYMVRSIVSKEIYRSTLEEELKEIALERDQVVHDRFDELICDCAILDLPGSVSAEELFRQAAEALAPRIGTDAQKLFELFRQREAQTSTVVQPGLAIPHVIVEGEKVFDVLLVRCREGVRFPAQAEPVRTAFVLVGSADERNYHLRALMTIAHIVQEHGFARRWLTAPHGETLRDIVLLSGRSRDLPKQKPQEQAGGNASPAS